MPDRQHWSISAAFSAFAKFAPCQRILCVDHILRLLLAGLLVVVLQALSPRLLAETDFVPVDAWTGPGLGTELDAIERALLPKHVFADGTGLPPGEGLASDGALLYAQRCASCHGRQGQGGRAMELVGDRSLLTTAYPDRGIAVYWPNAPTLFEYVYRSMPPDQPASLTDNEVYAVLAHLLVLNDLLDEQQPLNAATLASIRMPNHDGFRTLAR